MQLPKLVECLRKHVPGFENAYLTQIYSFIGIRESRRFNGISTLKADSIIAGEIPEDSIGLGSYIIDIHDGGGAGTIVKKVPPYGLPYGVTVSADIDNLMLTGRCVSVDSVVMSSLRVMPTCMVLGEGAGANWWCVMFPPLCIPSASKDMPQVEDVIGEEEYEMISSVKYKPAFALMEVYETVKSWICG